jgi:putative CocE/NonD family hydrolase
MLALALAPPARSDTAGRWREVWKERLAEVERRGPESLRWLEHPDFDDYWRALHVEVERIEVPTLLVAGWHDLYPAAMARVYSRLVVPKRMLAGPWLHVSPELAERQRIDWLNELIAWWEITLSGEQAAPANSVVYFAEGRGGGWRRSNGWPPPSVAEISLFLGEGGALVPDAEASESATGYLSDPTVGATAGLLDPLGIGVGYALDQGPDERASLCFTSAPWTQDFELAGSPVVELWMEVPGNLVQAVMVGVRLSDVAPDGGSTLITRGCMAVSGVLPIRIELRPTAYRVAAGHRLRLALAGADFPAVWPTPANAAIHVHHGGAQPSRVGLPVARAEDATPPPPIEPSPELSPWDAGGAPGWTIEYDQVEHGVAVTLAGRGALNLPGGSRFELEHTARAVVARAHPDQAALEADAEIQIAAPGRETVTVQARGSHSRTTMAYEGTVWVGDRVTFAHNWETNGVDGR